MTGDIPGYYFDDGKKKYFKILPNHVGRGSAYSTDVVNAKSTAKEVVRREERNRKRARHQRLTRSKLSQHPQLSFRRRIDGRSRGATADAFDFYCSALTRHRAFPFRGDKETFGPKFGIDDRSADLFVPFDGARYLGRFPRTSSSAECLWDAKTTGPNEYFPLPSQIDSLLIVPDACVVYSESATSNFSSIVALGLGNFHGPETRTVDWRTARSSIITFASKNRVWDMAASPCNPEWAVATESGVDLYYARNGITLLGVGGLNSKEHMAIGFRDQNTVMTGSRSGIVRFGDMRGGNVDRLRHSSAVNAIRVLQDTNKVVVSGLQSMSVYDLRYSAIPTQSRKCKPKAATQPFVHFNVPENRKSDRYGLGFDFDPELGVIASATSSGNSHYVSLYSAHTGRVIGDSSLNKSFADPVTCIKMSRLRDGSKSIVLASDQQLEEWTVSGTEKATKGTSLMPPSG